MSIIKRLDEARQAYKKKDKQASVAAHDPQRIMENTEQHSGAGSQYIGEMVYGGLDGIITSFTVVSGVSGAHLGAHVILILGLANLLADGFAMAIGSYLSRKSESEYFERERQREAWEVENYPDGERAELLVIYLKKGYSEEDARHLVEIKTRDKKLWVDTMMLEELHMLEEESNPLRNAVATYIAFVVAGAVPLLVYLLGLVVPIPVAITFPIAVGLSALALFGLGATKVFVTQRSPWRSGLEMLVVGGAAAAAAYLVGALLKGLGGA
jgi:vacuolar iron transporter family protein